MFHISQRTGAVVRVVRVLAVPSLLKLQPVCSASSTKRRKGWPSARGSSQYQSRKPLASISDSAASAPYTLHCSQIERRTLGISSALR